MKNKIAPPFRTAEFDIMFGKGIDYEGDLLELAVNSGVAQKSGSWFSYGETRLGQGRDRSAEFLRENADVLKKLDHETRIALGMIADPKAEAAKAKAEGAAAEASKASNGSKTRKVTPANASRKRETAGGRKRS